MDNFQIQFLNAASVIYAMEKRSTMRILFLIMLIGLSSQMVLGQSSDKKKKKEKEKYQTTQPTSKDPSFPTMDYQKRSKVKSKGITHNAEKNYHDQMARVEKARIKADKEMAKPQYSDPLYFGHKNPPKKHKPGKMKYCKECGIRH